ncbi:hypothetical protein MRX96_046069 [Rhipicephalus microplus]
MLAWSAVRSLLQAQVFTNTPTNEAPCTYACEICPSKFCQKLSLTKHKQLHASGVLVGICTECGKNFKSTKSLVHHFKWHNTEKVHACQLCPARLEIITPDNPFATEPQEDSGINETGPCAAAFGNKTSVMPHTSRTEISVEIKDGGAG